MGASFLLFSACAEKPTASATNPPITFSIAASTQEPVELLAQEFRKTHGVEVNLNAGPSSTLASQILAGAPVDVFLSANESLAGDIARHTERSVSLLTNRLVLVVPAKNPAEIQSPDDLASSKLQKLALAGENVPAGIYASQALSKLGLLEKLVAEGKIARGQSVRSALAFVERGEAEAGIVYATDVRASKGVEVVYEFDPALHEPIAYVLVLTKQGATNPAATKLFDFLQSSAASAQFTQFGFGKLP